MKKQIVLLGIMMIVVFAGSSVFGQIGLNSVFGGIGYIMTEGDFLGNAIGFGGGVNLGEIVHKVGLEADLTYWKKSYEWEQSYFVDKGDYSQLSIAGTVRYLLSDPDADIQPEIGGGLGYTRSADSWETTYTYNGLMKTSSPMATMDSSDSWSKSGIVLHLSGLVRKHFSPQMQGVAEVRYSLGGDDHGDNLGIWIKVNYLMNP